MYMWDKAELVGPYRPPPHTICPNSTGLSSSLSLSHPSVLSVFYSSLPVKPILVLFSQKHSSLLVAELCPEFLQLKQLLFHDPTWPLEPLRG